MSVDFYPAIDTPDGVRPALACACGEHDEYGTCTACTMKINMSNTNACDVMRFLGIDPEPYGVIRASDLAERCREAIAHPERARPRFGVITARVVQIGRDADYLTEKAKALLVVALLARNVGWVAWS